MSCGIDQRQFWDAIFVATKVKIQKKDVKCLPEIVCRGVGMFVKQ